MLLGLKEPSERRELEEEEEEEEERGGGEGRRTKSVHDMERFGGRAVRARPGDEEDEREEGRMAERDAFKPGV